MTDEDAGGRADVDAEARADVDAEARADVDADTPGDAEGGPADAPATADAASGPDDEHPLAWLPDAPAARAGVVVAAVALAAALMPWTDAPPLAPPVFGAGSSLAAALAALALAAFLARRVGALDDRPAAALAGLGAAGVIAVAMVRFVGPETGGGEPPTVGVGLPVAALAGLVALGLAAAVDRGLSLGDVVERLRRTGVGLGLLVAVFVVASLLGASLSTVEFGLVTGRVVSTLLFDAVLVGVTVAFLVQTGRGLSFIDVRRPSVRDLAYAGAGFVGLIAGQILVVIAVLGLGLPSQGNRILEGSRENPELLLVLIPLQFIAVAPAEELFNRNLLQKYFYGAYSRPAAIVVASGVFASAHLFSYSGDSAAGTLVAIVAVLVLGSILGLVYERTDNILVPIAVHGAYNATLFALRYVAIVYGDAGQAAVVVPW